MGDNNVIAANSITNNAGNGVNIGGPSTATVLHGNRLESNRIANNGNPANTLAPSTSSPPTVPWSLATR